jgi:photosystem II stability/assembly factor-like uncharacterized protein
MKSLLLAIFICCSVITYAQSQWERTNTPYGGRVTSVNKSLSGILYATTATGLYKSGNNGQNWESIDFPANWPMLAVDNAGNLFATTDSVIMMSSDGGDTWAESLTTSGFFSSIEKSSTNVLYAGHMNWDGVTTVYVSHDSGQNWIPKTSNIGNYSHLRLESGTMGEIYAATDIGLFKSTDEGDTWANILPGNIRSVVVNDANRLFVGIFYRDNIYTSIEGENWETFFKGPHIYPVGSDSEGVYAIDDNTFYYIKNDPTSWSEIIGLPGEIESLFIDEEENVYAGSDGIYRSANNGADWENISTGIQSSTFLYMTSNTTGELYAISSAIYHSADNADSFDMVADALTYNRTINEILIHPSGSLFAIGNDQGADYGNTMLFRSYDNGETFDPVLYMNINHFRMNAQGHLFVATNAGLLRSTDEGESWAFLDTGPECMTDYSSLEINEAGDIYVIDCQQVVYKSSDNGDNFQTRGTTEGNLQAINQQGHLFAIAAYNIYRSVDDGLTWQSVYQNNLPYNTLRDLVIDPTGNLYFTIANLGVYRSTDNGDNWVEFNEGLDYLNIMSIHTTEDGYLYVSPDGGGIWKRNLLETVKKRHSLYTRIYPNPASDNITIETPVNYEPVTDIVNIYTMEGTLMKSFSMNTAVQTYNVSDLKPGVYMVKRSGEEGSQKLVKH